MPSDRYYVITCGEDGIYISEFEDEVELEKWITEKFNPDEAEAEEEPVFLDKVPDIDKGYFYFREYAERVKNKNAIVIIKGRTIIPTPVEVVTKYKFWDNKE